MTAAPGALRSPQSTHRRAVVIALFVLGLLTTGTGLYFMALRPPLLPEDMRFAELSGSAAAPLVRWLSIVFRTWGGFITGFGICLLGQAVYFKTSRDLWLRVGTAAGALVAFSSFLISNLQLHSDFLWFIALLFVVALGSAALLLLEQARIVCVREEPVIPQPCPRAPSANLETPARDPRDR